MVAIKIVDDVAQKIKRNLQQTTSVGTMQTIE